MDSNPIGQSSILWWRAIGVKAQVDVLAVDAARPGFESQILHKILTMKKKFDAH
jgi:hypothetical protein